MASDPSEPSSAAPSQSELPTLVKGIEAPDSEELSAPLMALTFDQRYPEQSVIGEGGMGVVRLHHDQQVGRRVAMKVLRQERAGSPELEARFVREARIQGQLEHPAVVPVYDLGIDPDGATYFTMKRIRGVTLATIIDQLIVGDAEFAKRYPRRRLLTALSNVCLAVDFAHERGVIHRDLKPDNIMLGDFGEVYVLDWGLAKLGPAGARQPADPDRTDQVVELSPGPAAPTMVGAVMGTPGFMAPEQVSGTTAPAPAWDVYALGAVLFEVLALRPLHPAATPETAFESTLQGVEARPSIRSPGADIAPELDAICVRATSQSPPARFRSARAVHEALESYLGGRRDVERRRELAKQHAEAAASAVEKAQHGRGEIEARRSAMQELGRSLALDPSNEQAMLTLVRLLTNPPSALPAEVEMEMARAELAKTRWIGRFGAIAYGSLLLYLPFLLWMGVRNVSTLVAFYIAATVCVGLGLWAARQRKPSPAIPLAASVVSNVAFMFTAGFFGPFVVTPALVAVNTTAFALHARRAYRPVVILVGCLAVLIPIVLEVLGVLGCYRFTSAGMTIVPHTLDLPTVPTQVVLAFISLGTVITSCLSSSRIRDALEDAEQRLYLYAWHLREFVPESARPATDPTAAVRRVPGAPEESRAGE